MRRRMLLCLTLIAMGACNGDTVSKPTTSPAAPSRDISDAVHSGVDLPSNPDFFFLPPMVKDPSGSPLWDVGAFNPNLHPTVEICSYPVSVTTEASLATIPAPACTLMSTLAAVVDPAAEQYAVNWKVPTSPTTFYRITVKVGSRRLGFADVQTASNMSQLKNVATSDFIPLNDGRTLPIKVRIERSALCDNPLAGGCTSASGDIGAAPLTVSTGTPDPSGISTATGITLPLQTAFPSTPVTVTLSSCPGLNPRVIDLPTFGDCVRVTTDPVLKHLSDPATVFVCTVGIGAPGLFTGLTETQEARVTLHQYDADGPNQGLRALPHAAACTPGNPGGVVASTSPSLGAMLASLVLGRFKQAASTALSLLAPKPAYAAMFIDLGGGGLTADCCSDFQFALPAKMEIVEGVAGQTVQAGTILSPTVRVTDLGGEPVAGAVVHFFTNAPAPAGDVIVTTKADGLASQPWTIALGANTLPVSGRGIASLYVNGPRGASGEFDSVLDPFQPIQAHFDPGFTGIPQPVFVRTGSVLFSATGTAIGSASASVTPQSFSGACPEVFTFSGTIVSKPGSIVSYVWDRSDGATMTPLNVTLDETGAATVTDTWQLTTPSFSGWERLRVTLPDGSVVTSPQASFTLTCVPS